MIFQAAFPIAANHGIILLYNYKHDDIVLAKKLFATSINYNQENEDIVQGLPKIEELIETIKPKYVTELATSAGILLKNFSSDLIIVPILKQEIFKCYFLSSFSVKKNKSFLNQSDDKKKTFFPSF